MESSPRSARKALRAFAALATIVCLTALAAQAASAAHRSGSAPAAAAATAAGHKCVVATGSGDQAFTRNFNPFNSGAMRDFTQGGIYETLIISTAFGGGHIYNVLASKVAYSNGGKTLTITLRPGVKWSDGKPLTTRDVLYSLTAGRQDKFMDRIGLTSAGGNIASVKLVGKNKVAIRFKQVDSTFVGSVLSSVFIVPQHIWSKVRNVADFTNPRPVGSGPFTRITRFNGQDYVLGKNLHYWQKGLPRVPCIERLAAAGNDAALLQIVSGQADWTHNFVPNVERAYIAHDKKHYHASYLGVGLPIDLFFDLTKYPYSLPAFRKGVSQAIDRQKVVKLGEYGYAPAVNALGIEKIYPTWLDPKLARLAKKLATYSPAAARKVFTDAGFKYRGGDLIDPKGDKVSFQIHVIGGWSDWVASLQIIARNLQDVGIDASVKLEPDWGAWQPNAMSTKFTTLLWNNGGQDITPYAYFFAHYDPSTNLGPGVDASATGNWEHYQHSQGAALLKQFKSTLSVKKQKQIAYQLQAIWLNNLPAVPLFVGPRWSTYSTKYWTGFPTYANAYVDPIFTTGNQVEKILLNLRPSKG
jgi:peptide/nickel transport system substrate-binding protein